MNEIQCPNCGSPDPLVIVKRPYGDYYCFHCEMVFEPQGPTPALPRCAWCGAPSDQLTEMWFGAFLCPDCVAEANDDSVELDNDATENTMEDLQ